jgi:hypothetical protein
MDICRHPLVETALEEVSAIYKKHGLNAISIVQSPEINDDKYAQVSFTIHLENADPDIIVKIGPAMGVKTFDEFNGTAEEFAKKVLKVYQIFRLMGGALKNMFQHIKDTMRLLAPSIDADDQIEKIINLSEENQNKKANKN